MKCLLRRAGATLLLLSVGAAAMAQTCRNDIRATAPDERFTDNGDGTVTDAATGLMWKQCAEGLSGTGCANSSAEAFTWQQALEAASAANFPWNEGWRLPNKNELESLVERRCIDPAINATFYPNTPSDWFWSSSPKAGYPDRAWGVAFNHAGAVDYDYKSNFASVRLVRDAR